jgi:hypothetical protein
MIPLAAFEEVIDASGVAAGIEVLLPAGVRPRQLRVRTLLAGMCLAAADHRPAHLTRVHQALTALPEPDQRRLGVLADWKHGPHQLTYRQTERTFGLVADVLGKDEPDGLPSPALQAICDGLLEASVPGQFKDTSRSLAVDWTDLDSFSRDARAWAVPLRAAGAQLIQDLHPSDRGPKGTHAGTVIANGNPYCPQTPRPLLDPGPLSCTATQEQAADHDRKTAELARYKLGRITADDTDGYHRVACPAVTGKIRCPLRPASMALDRGRPEILQPPEHPQACCTQQTLTIPPGVTAKTRQKHDYPSAAWRRSYARRTGAERGFATAKDPATNDISRGWCRLMGLAPLMLFTTTLLIVRNQRILAAWNARQQENDRRAAQGLPPKTRRRRRKTLMPAATPP